MEKEKAKLLMKQIEEIEAEILQNQDILKANNIGMDEPLTDDQDFPRADIDHYAVRAARGKIRSLQTDYKTKMAEMEAVLFEIHKSTAENEVEKGAKENEPQVHRTSNDPFVQVEKVVPDSPAKEAGLCDGDLIVQFGPLYADIFQRLDQLKEVVMGSVNKPIRMTVLRNVRVQHLQLTPRNWSGSGLVGCSFTVVEKNKKHK